jgi:hypothetical protein
MSDDNKLGLIITLTLVIVITLAGVIERKKIINSQCITKE